MMDFLYFPENKLEYLPAMIALISTFVIAMLTMTYLVKFSKREESKARELEQKLSQREKQEQARTPKTKQ